MTQSIIVTTAFATATFVVMGVLAVWGSNTLQARRPANKTAEGFQYLALFGLLGSVYFMVMWGVLQVMSKPPHSDNKQKHQLAAAHSITVEQNVAERMEEGDKSKLGSPVARQTQPAMAVRQENW